MKERVATGGAIAGCLFGGMLMFSAVSKAPVFPGGFELLTLLMFAQMFAIVGGLAGLLLGWVLSLIQRK